LDRIILKQDVSCKQLSQDAAKGPDVDLVVILAAQDYFRSTIAPALDVRAEMIVDEAT